VTNLLKKISSKGLIYCYFRKKEPMILKLLVFIGVLEFIELINSARAKS